MKNHIIIFILFCFASTAYSQERMGLRIENYSGVNGLFLNPASGTMLPFGWDLNIISIEQFTDNNFGHIRNANIFKIKNNQDEIVSINDYENESQIPNGALVAAPNEGDDLYYGQNSSQIMGPSFLYNLDGRHSFGLLTSFRAVGGTRAIPKALGYLEYDAMPQDVPFDIGPFKAAGAAWAEFGLHYGYNNDDNLYFGVNAKFLAGFEGFYFNSYENVTVTKRADNMLDFNSGDGEFGVTNTYLIDEEFNGVSINGTGLGLDIGMMYTIENDYDDNYLLKFGVSILDLGYLHFNNNAESHRLINNGDFTFDLDDYEELTEYTDFVTLLNSDVYNDFASPLSSTFNLTLPTALSLQVDYAIRPNLFLNGTIIQHIPLGVNRIARTDFLAITPRYENRWIGVMLPISMLNYDQVHVGLSLRLAFITIGSENLGSIFGSSNFTGSDIYFALKFNPFSLGERDRGWKGSNKRGVQRRGKKKAKCYNF